jgi:thiosulfate dehydrogenase
MIARAIAPATVLATMLHFEPPAESAIPGNAFGNMVRLGRAIFTETKQHAGKYVGNDLRCSNCHLDAGRLPDSAPLWGAFVAYPQYRAKTGEVDTFAERPQDPRYAGSIAATRKKYYDSPNSLYGTVVDGHLLGRGTTR